METLSGYDPDADTLKAKEARIDAKVAGIKGNPGESRSDEEIRVQAKAELETEDSQQ